MGIGLSVSRAIIESHQGRLWARANEGAVAYLIKPFLDQALTDALAATLGPPVIRVR